MASPKRPPEPRPAAASLRSVASSALAHQAFMVASLG
ncbi:rCG48906 [Rattus norvegicus]|uniref:RCG48906 n=1 Tax=Rattus norvegicus TaxID=10116 RepID=A6IFD1_RAT|nr:rCG48906 [Rattus norvegicus]